MFKYILFISISLILVSCDIFTQKVRQPIAENGTIDLRNWDFEKDGNINLEGEWEFCWKQFLSSKCFDILQIKDFINVPSWWNKKDGRGHDLPFEGFASYRVKILLNKNIPPLDLKICPVRTAYKLFINNDIIGSVGLTGTTEKTSQPAYKHEIFEVRINSDTLDLVFWVSNFSYWKGGITDDIYLGSSSNIRKADLLNIIHDSFIIGCFLILFIHFIFVYIYRSKSVIYLNYSIWCLACALRILATGELIIVKIFPMINWELLIKIELGTIYLYSLFGVLYWYFFGNLYYIKKIFRILIIICSIFFLIVIFTPAVISSQFLVIGKQFIFLLILVFFACIISLIKKKDPNGMFFLFGFVFYSIGCISEILHTSNINILSYDYFNFANGNLLFMILIAITLSRQFSDAYSTIENLSEELIKHKDELELKVEERTSELKLEKEKSDRLLLNILPEQIADRLKEGETTIADHFDEASVVFIDQVDFTKHNKHAKPEKIVEILNHIYTEFDKIAEKHGLEKIKTIGDCYMAASGIPTPREDHAEAAAMFAIEAMEAMKNGSGVLGLAEKGSGFWVQGLEEKKHNEINERNENNENNEDNEIFNNPPYHVLQTQDPKPKTQEIQFRCGIDCGPVVAGVIGEKKFIYDLWGDTVNTSSRMEEYGEPGKIHVTERFKGTLEIPFNPLLKKGESEAGGFVFHERGEIEIKGKGKMRTYFLEK